MPGGSLMLEGKHILLGICGSIAAYKAAVLTRLLIKSGANVRVIMTPSATGFVTPLTLSTLSHHPVVHELFSDTGWHNHVEYGLWADAYVIAPATANTMARMVSGQCENMVEAAWLSARCPVFVAPAMDLEMWRHPSTRRNCATLEKDGVRIIPVGSGELASGLNGAGRMAEPEDIVEFLDQSFRSDTSLSGKKILLTAGPTREPIDPVRFLSNPSSGKMGVALALAAAAAGAEVTLVSGPVPISLPQHSRIHIISVQTAQEMRDAAVSLWPHSDIGILCAAVSDWRPQYFAAEKLKKTGQSMTLNLERTPDIAQELGGMKKKEQILVGFALETENEIEHAKEKLKKKHFDMIVLNSLKDAGAGFETDTNKVTLIHASGRIDPRPLSTKKAVAQEILAALVGTHLKPEP